MLSDDFDLDALLAAQSSDDEDVDLQDLERSLDEILNDNADDDTAASFAGVSVSKDEEEEKASSAVNGRRHEADDFTVVERDEEEEEDGEGRGELGVNLNGKPRGLDVDVRSRTEDSEISEAAVAGIVSFPDTPRSGAEFSSEGRDGDRRGFEDLSMSQQSVESSAAELMRHSWESRRKYGPVKEGTEHSRVSSQPDASGSPNAGAKSSKGWDGVFNAMPGASWSGSPVTALPGHLGLSIGTRVSPRPGAALALAAAASRQVARTTSPSIQSSFPVQDTDFKQPSEYSEFSFGNLGAPLSTAASAAIDDAPLLSQVETDIRETQIGMTDSDSFAMPTAGEGTLEFENAVNIQENVNGLDESSLSGVLKYWKSKKTTPDHEEKNITQNFSYFSDNQLQALPSFSDALVLQEHVQQAEPNTSVLDSQKDVQDWDEEEFEIKESRNLINDVEEADASNIARLESNKGFDVDSESDDLQQNIVFENTVPVIVPDEESSDSVSSSSMLGAQMSSPEGNTEVIGTQSNSLSESEIQDRKDGEPLYQPTMFELAEELEMRNATSGLHWEEGAAAQPMRLVGIQRGPPAIGLLQLDSDGTLSHALASPVMRRDHGSPLALAVHANFIAVGMSKGAVLVTPSKYSATRSADELDAKKAFLLGGAPTDKMGPVSSICFNHQGDLLLVGYANGTLRLWDVLKGSVSKVIAGEHNAAIVHTLFLGQDAPAARCFLAISGDCKGMVLLHTFSQQLVPYLRRFSVQTQCLLDGERTGTLLSVSPLLPDEGYQVLSGLHPAHQGGATPPSTLGSVVGGVMGGVVGGVGAMDVGRKFLYDGATSADEGAGGMVVFVTHQTVLVVRLVQKLEVCSRLTRPEGIRDGAIPYTAWRRIRSKMGSSGLVSLPKGSSDVPAVMNGNMLNEHLMDGGHAKEEESDVAKDGLEDDDDAPILAMAWDKRMIILQLTKTELRKVGEWELDSPAIGIAWLEEQMLVVVTAKDQLCLFTKGGIEVERASIGGGQENIGALIYHTYMLNPLGNPEKAYHSSLSVRGAALYLLGPLQLWRARLLPWRDRIKALQDAGDWMGAFHIAMELYDGRARGVTGLPRGLDAMREAIMSTLLALLSAYIDEAFTYLSLSFGTISVSSVTPPSKSNDGRLSAKTEATSDAAESWETAGMGQDVQEARDQYARVGGVAIEFCVHIGKQEVLFENVFSKFVAVGQRGTFLELLEPYILKDMLGGLAPEVMQALVEHYSGRGWLERVEQCVLHMDIGSLDFNQVVKLCREHGLYSALIYLFNKGLDDFRSPLEELLTVADEGPLSQAETIGFKLLVYLKYCFFGLAFPPGHGSLPAKRLPGLRGEILQFLLDHQGPIRGHMSSAGEDARVYPRLWYLLHLDTHATLLVLKFAFPENGPLGIGKQGYAYLPGPNNGDLVVANSEDVDDGVRYVQAVVNALIEILNAAQKLTTDLRGYADNTQDTQKSWPSTDDVGCLLDFVAQFVASRHAVVSSFTFMRILEYLASSTPGSKNGTEKEDLMVTMLSAVPESSWDVSRTLLLAQESNFWQVSAMLHTHAGDYEAALDYYLSDKLRMPQPFNFIMQILDHKIDRDEASVMKFKEAVLSRIPQLMQHNIKGTLWIVLEHLSGDNERIFAELESRPRLLFYYLKSIMDVRSGGIDYNENLPNGQQPSLSKFSTVGCSPDWEPNVDLQTLLHRSEVKLTDEMAELYVQLMCQFEPRSVLKFLESYENYRLENCLRLCQEYGITDAAIFLLERVGDVASALSLVLADLDTRRHTLERSISTLPSISAQAFSKDDKWIMNIPEVAAVKSAVAVALSLCQRNTQRLEPQESISLWFRLLDRIVEPFRDQEDAINGKSKDNMSYSSQGLGNGGRIKAQGKSRKIITKSMKGKLVRKVLVAIMGDTIDGMMGYVPLHVIMEKILADHGSDPFGDFRPTVLNMLSAYGYERTILRTAKQLIEEDAFSNISALRRGCTHGYAAISSTCCICELGLEDVKIEGHGRSPFGARSGSEEKLRGRAGDTCFVSAESGSNGFSIFYCGHAAHNACINSRVTMGADTGLVGCPVCSLKVKSSSLLALTKKASRTGEGVDAGVGKLSPGQGTRATYLQGTAIKSRNSSVGFSRLDVLKQLQHSKDLPDLGPLLVLRLAPPRKHRPRNAAPSDGSSTSRNRPAQRILLGSRR